MMMRKLLTAVAASLLLVSASQAATYVCTTTADTYIDSDYGGVQSVNYGTGSQIMLYGSKDHTVPGARDGLLFFDTSILPVGFSVTNAVLSIKCQQESTDNSYLTLSAYGVKTEWTETEATWTNCKTATAWAGGNFSFYSQNINTTPAGSVSRNLGDGTFLGWHHIPVTTLVQEWPSTPNRGICLQVAARVGANFSPTPIGLRFYSRETSDDPYLTVSGDMVVIAIPAAPSGLNVTAESAYRCSLSWTDNSTNETIFRIERSLDGVTFPVTNSVSANVTTFIDEPPLTADTVYYYRVSAVNVGGSSSYSNIDSDRTWLSPTVGECAADTYLEFKNGLPVTTNDMMPLVGYLYGTNSTVINDGDDDHSGDVRDVLLKFNTNGISGQIDYAIVRIFCSREDRATTSVGTVTVHPVMQDWSEIEGTWVNRNSSGGTWNGGGFESGVGNYDAVIPGSTRTNSLLEDWAGTWVEFRVDSLVDSWVNGGTLNNGLVIRTFNSVNSQGKRFDWHTRENANKPQLIVYTSPSTVTPPSAAPTGLTATDLSAWDIRLDWTDNSTNEASFQIERSLNGSVWSNAATVASNVLTYTDMSLTPATWYYYRVRAVNGAGASDYSNVATNRTWNNPAVLSCLEDTYVSLDDGQPDPYRPGLDTTVYIDGDLNHGGTVRDGLFRFNLSSVTGTIDYAIFKVYCSEEQYANTKVSVMKVSGVLQDWTEVDATWTNRTATAPWNNNAFEPAGANFDATPWLTLTNTLAEDWTGSWREFIVTPLVDQWVNVSKTNCGLVLQSFCELTNAKRFTFSSSEGSPATAPQLIVYYRSAAGMPAPDAPNTLTAIARSAWRIDLAWVDVATNETGFEIERKTGPGGTYAPIGSALANATNYIDLSCEPDREYFYRVRASNAGGKSSYSNEDNDRTWPNPSIAPCIADTYVELKVGVATDTNMMLAAYGLYGTNTPIIADGNKDHVLDVRDCLLKFDLSSVPTGTITTAILKIYCVLERDWNTKNGSLHVHGVWADWNETEATWAERLNGVAWGGGAFEPGEEINYNTQLANPLIDPTLTLTAADSVNLSGTWIELDVTPLADQWVNQSEISPNYGLMIQVISADGGSRRMDFASRESGANAPQLYIYQEGTTGPSFLNTTFSGTNMTFETTIGMTYKYAHTANLITGPWVTSASFVATLNPFTIVDTNATAGVTNRFYKLIREDP